MTRSQRAKVVELLRCAADCCGRPIVFPLSSAVLRLAPSRKVQALAERAFHAAWKPRRQDECHRVRQDKRHRALLEAAARVEEGSWPP
ncbi:MAG: hypothetical protein ACTHU0_19240 [Kofleriaceae bacterium]